MACTNTNGQLCGGSNVENSPGAMGLAAFYYLGSQGSLGNDTANSIVNQIVSYGFTSAMQECKEAFVAQQEVSITCDDASTALLVQTNANCTMCKEQVAKFQSERTDLENKAHEKNPKYTVQTPSPELKHYLDQSVCKYVCDQCVAAGINQNLSMKITDQCSTSTTTFVDAFRNNVAESTKVFVNKHEQGLKNAGFQISNRDDVSAFSANISNTIVNMTSLETFSSLQTSGVYLQQVSINPGSTSVALQNVSQTISINQLSTLVGKIFNERAVANAINLKDKQSVLQLQTSLGDVVNQMESVVDTLDHLLTSIIGRIMLTVLVLLFTACLVFAAVLFFQPSFLFGGAL